MGRCLVCQFSRLYRQSVRDYPLHRLAALPLHLALSSADAASRAIQWNDSGAQAAFEAAKNDFEYNSKELSMLIPAAMTILTTR